MNKAAPAKPRCRRLRRVGLALLALALLAAAWYHVRILLRPKAAPLSAAQRERALRVKILRDKFGVAHVFGKTDADAAFGQAYAHAEDDYPTIELTLIAARGQLARRALSVDAIGNDYYVQLFRIREQTAAQWQGLLSPELRAVCEGYAEGLNAYAASHPHEADGRFLPYTGEDIIGGFVHKLPWMLRAVHAMKLVLQAEAPLPVGQRFQHPERKPSEMMGSNAHAVGPGRSADGKTRININSHQPWSGPVAWHEVHVVSEEGWNVSGANFPGVPMAFVGHNDTIAWAHTFNNPDFVDLYRLELDPQDPSRYRLDGEWLSLEQGSAAIAVDTGLCEVSYRRPMFWSRHGPVLVTPHGSYAIRSAGLERHALAAEQWFRMNKARNLDEFKAAMRIQGIPLFNTVYADRRNIYYVYNALLPLRKEGPDWLAVLPGDRADLIWTGYLPFDELPAVENPPSSYIQNCNSSPFETTVGPGNPDPNKYPKVWGLTTRMTNRAIRSHETFGADESITHEEFLTYKWDRQYSKAAPIYQEAIAPILKGFQPANAIESEALELLRGWSGGTELDDLAAALVILTYRPIWAAIEMDHQERIPDPIPHFRAAIQVLQRRYGRVAVPLGEVQRLRIADLDLPLGGGPDVMNAAHGLLSDGKIIGAAGDSFVMVAELGDEGIRAWAVQNYGNINRASSPHFKDQAPLFLKRQLRPVPRSVAEIRAQLEREYTPTEEGR